MTMQSFTLHKYIQLRDYESSLSEAHKTLPFGPEKILKILILANLAILLSHLISLTGEWDLKPAEERGLSINNIIQMFPSHFLAQEEKTSTAEAQVIVELRTQVFFLLFRQLRDERGDLGDWNTEEKIREVLQLDQGSQSDEKKVLSLISHHSISLRAWTRRIELIVVSWGVPQTRQSKSFRGLSYHLG